MKIHEYQAKELLKSFGVPVPLGYPAMTVDEAYEAAKKLPPGKVVVKAQIHAGGRGKGGGVKVTSNPEDARARASEILGMRLKTHQTGPDGQLVRRLLIEAGAAIKQEIYAGFVLDREAQRVTFMLSSEGGMDIEEVAKKTPGKIVKLAIDPVTGLMPNQVRSAWTRAGLDSALLGAAAKMMTSLYDAYIGTDASLLEVNPLIITSSNELVALDAKMSFDDNALYRQPKVVAMRDLDEEDEKEIEAKKFDLSYIALDGNIGCMVNGAGLAMGTMDIIKLAGGRPANFLDVGGGADAVKVAAAFRIILKDPAVKAVLVNIFGGIMKCDTIAEGIIAAAKETRLAVPVVVRLEGTRVELGRKMLAESGLDLVPAADLTTAAKKVVELAGKE
ncbi:MAG: ADP-forming succinate--CoA ligase subunit beta [Deltaproteobacteria bacterium]|nr:ADP-forming succinate--CoA ligase subunit beta [Deltaproteobacteria bacterium]